MMKNNIEWNNTNHHEPKKTFIIPVNDLTEEEAKQRIKELMKLYKERIDFPDDVVVKINNTNHNKDIWYPNN